MRMTASVQSVERSLGCLAVLRLIWREGPRGRLILPQGPRGRRSDHAKINSEIQEHLGGDALSLTQNPKEEVLGCDVRLAVHVGFSPSKYEYFGRARREWQLLVRGFGSHTDNLPDSGTDRLEVSVGREDPRRIAAGLPEQPQEDVFSAEIVTVQGHGLGCCKPEHITRGRGHR